MTMHLIWHSLGQEVIVGLVREVVLNWKVCQIIKLIIEVLGLLHYLVNKSWCFDPLDKTQTKNNS